MNRRRVFALAAKDLRVVRRSPPLMIPMIVVPLLLLVAVPALLTSLPLLMRGTPEGEAQLQRLFEDLPPTVRAMYAGSTPAQAWILLVNEQLFPPLFLLVPLILVNVIAADSFAGERERRTLESLLYTPLTDAELFLGKVLSAWLPAVAVSVLGLAVYSTAVNAVAWPILQRVFVPTTSWLVMAAWVAPGFALFGLAGTILISLRVRGTQEAIQLGGLFVLPVIALLVGQVRGVLKLGAPAVFALGAVAWILGGTLLAYGVRAFRRSRLITRI